MIIFNFLMVGSYFHSIILKNDNLRVNSRFFYSYDPDPRLELQKEFLFNGCTGYPAILVTGIRPDIRFNLPDMDIRKMK